jgi:hypothetical protein
VRESGAEEPGFDWMGVQDDEVWSLGAAMLRAKKYAAILEGILWLNYQFVCFEFCLFATKGASLDAYGSEGHVDLGVVLMPPHIGARPSAARILRTLGPHKELRDDDDDPHVWMGMKREIDEDDEEEEEEENERRGVFFSRPNLVAVKQFEKEWFAESYSFIVNGGEKMNPVPFVTFKYFGRYTIAIVSGVVYT